MYLLIFVVLVWLKLIVVMIVLQFGMKKYLFIVGNIVISSVGGMLRDSLSGIKVCIVVVWLYSKIDRMNSVMVNS